MISAAKYNEYVGTASDSDRVLNRPGNKGPAGFALYICIANDCGRHCHSHLLLLGVDRNGLRSSC